MADIFGPVQHTGGGDIFAPVAFDAAPVVGSADVNAPAATMYAEGNVQGHVSGQALVVAPVATLSADGTVPAFVVGSADMRAEEATVTGEGIGLPGVVGAGDMFGPEPTVSATGTVTIGVDGTAALDAPEATMSATGTAVPAEPPVINDGGNLSVVIPHYATATETDEPTVAAWLASFTATAAGEPVPVTNNAPFILYKAGSPISVTFSATNVAGTTILTRTLTITESAVSNPLDPWVTDFRLQNPAFMDPTLYPWDALNRLLDRVPCWISDRNCGRLTGSCRLQAIYYMGAHLLFMQAQAIAGKGVNIVTQASIDAISVSLMQPPDGSQWSWWLNGSPYGQALQALLSAKSVGGFYIGGSRERQGFRKTGGGFW